MNAENEFNSTAGIDQRNGTSGNPWADKQIIDQVRDFQFIKAAVCPGTESYKDCYYPKTNINISNNLVWSCKEGTFCMTPFDSQPCPPGFYCPDNTAQPIYCPSRYYCSMDTTRIYRCPPDYYCPLATVKPLPCTLGICAEGSDSGMKIYLFAILACWFAVGRLIIRLINLVSAMRMARKERTRPTINRWSSKEQLISTPSQNRVQKKLTIEFQDLSLRINGTQILHGLTGKLQSGRTCAIMGPSGSGKTSLISVLMGKRRQTSGKVLINGTEKPISDYQKLIGYVPQDDIMLRELTVEETLMHSAQMRLPRKYSRNAIKDKVDDVLAFLGLSAVRNSLIGDEVIRGISGGQRRRVNIGMELVAEPIIMFLDEPTSGLDSSTSKEICNLLRLVANEQNILCAAIIHSPNPAAFEEFDDLILLGKGGEMVYMGPRAEASAYFSSIGFQPTGSLSDYYMDVVSGNVECSMDPNFNTTDLFVYWRRHITAKIGTFAGPVEPSSIKIATITDLESGSLAIKVGASSTAASPPVDPLAAIKQEQGSIISSIVTKELRYRRIINRINRIEFVWALYDLLIEFVSTVRSTALLENTSRKTPRWPYKFWLLFRRSAVQLYRSKESVLSGQILHAVCGFFISVGVSNFTYLAGQPAQVCNYAPVQLQSTCRNPIDFIGPMAVLMCMGAVFASTSDGTLTFGMEKTVYWRDTATGMPTTAYFLAKLLTDCLKILLNSFMFSICFIAIYANRATLPEIYVIIMALYFNGYALGYFLSTFISRKNISLACTGACLLWPLVLSGTFITLSEAQNNFGPIYFLWDLSAPRWAVEALWLREVGNRPFTNVKLPSKYNWNNFGLAIGKMYISTAVWLALAYLGLKLFDRRKQK